MRLAGAPIDREHLSDEERYMFQKLGLRMKAFLLLGKSKNSTLLLDIAKNVASEGKHILEHVRYH